VYTRFQHKIDQQQTSLKDRFVSYIFHEIRVPLNAIVIGIKNLSQNKDLCDTDQRTIGIINSSLDQATHILNDILDLNKIEAGRFTLQKTAFPLEQLIDETGSTFREITVSKKIDLVTEVSPRLVGQMITADKYRIIQCLNNFLSNAFKYTKPQGKITLIVTPTTDDVIRFSVTDTGCGITPENQRRLFKPYIQIGNALNSEIGTGLGLVITKQIATLHGGQVGVSSVIGTGSTFWFTISSPRTARRDSVEVVDYHAIEETRQTYSKLCFLIVDDNEANCVMLSEYLKHKGIGSDYVLNGLEAVNKIKGGERYDLIIMDKHMPVMDGIQATAAIRELNIDIPIVALTGLSDDVQKNKLLQAGVNEIFIKPFNFQLFDDLLENLFR
jgi:CheY-like chemotaxis protein